MLATMNYASAKGKFPAAYSAGADGNPNLSWRVHLLPFLEQETLYEQFNLNEPWDSPNNRKLITQIPNCFWCGYHRAPIPVGHTAYKMVVDDGTTFEPGRSFGFHDLADGSSNTVALVKDKKNPVPWTKPEDLTVDEAVAVLSVKSFSEVAHSFKGRYGTMYGGSAVGMMDGATYLIRPGIDPEVVRGWCLVDDGRGFKFFDYGKLFLAAKRKYYSALGLYFLLLLLPGIVLLTKRATKSIRKS
jgi:hypothetical protein